jgi:hypothetical protein
VLHPGQGCTEVARLFVVPEMPKRPSVKSTIKQLLDAGLEIARVEVSADKVVVFAGKPGDAVRAYGDLDQWIDKHAHAVEGY